MPSSIPKCKKTVKWIMKRTPVLDKFCSEISHSAIGHEFNVNQQYSTSKKGKRKFTFFLHMRLLQKVLK